MEQEPMTTTMTIETYKFNELSGDAKERAREWYRPSACDDNDWFEFVYEDAATCGGILGIEFDHVGKSVKTPEIYFSGFSSQGDGACFVGRYSYAKRCNRLIRKHAPVDAELHRIADELVEVQRLHQYKLEAQISARRDNGLRIEVTHAGNC